MTPEQRFKQMESEIAKLRSEIRARPIRIPPQRPTSHLVQVFVSSSTNNKALAYGGLRGNKFDLTFTPLTPGAPLAAAYNPFAETGITDDGICYGTTSSGLPILIVNRQINDAFGNVISQPILSFDLPQTCVFLAYRQVQVPAPAGAYVTAFEAYWA